MSAGPVNRWREAEHVMKYLALADDVPHRREGEAVLLEILPRHVDRVLDLGTGDGRLIELVRAAQPTCEAIGLDFSPAMLDRATERFADHPGVEIRAHDLDDPLPDLGSFDVVVSSFAIHHLVDERKRSLFAEVFACLEPGGLLANLEHVDSPTDRLHLEFLAEVGVTPDDDDPSNKLAPVHSQLGWLREVGFENVECFWKWRELALLAGWRPRD